MSLCVMLQRPQRAKTVPEVQAWGLIGLMVVALHSLHLNLIYKRTITGTVMCSCQET